MKNLWHKNVKLLYYYYILYYIINVKKLKLKINKKVKKIFVPKKIWIKKNYDKEYLLHKISVPKDICTKK